MLNYFLPCSSSYNLSSFWLTLKQQWTIKISSPLFSIFSLAAILVGSRDHRTKFWKGAIQGPFHQSLVAIGPVVSEEKIKMWSVDGRTTDDRRRTKSDDNSSPGLKARWAKKSIPVLLLYKHVFTTKMCVWNLWERKINKMHIFLLISQIVGTTQQLLSSMA